MIFNTNQLEIIHYCAQECKRQGSGEVSVYNMVNAWEFAAATSAPGRDTPKSLTLAFIEQLGRLVEPEKNKNGFRTVPIFVGNRFDMHEKAPWDRVPDLLSLLLESYYFLNLSEEQFYYEYENIHPFVDGNGRSGKILYNYLCGRLETPIMPPNFWGSSNP